MKKTLLALILALSLVFACTAVLSVSAEETTSYLCNFSTFGGGAAKTSWTGGMVGRTAYNYDNASSGNAVYVTPKLVGGLGDHETKLTTSAALFTNGTRRTTLFAFDKTVPAGTYTMTVWVCDTNNFFAETSEQRLGLLLTFHAPNIIDGADNSPTNEEDELYLDWNDTAKTNAAVMIAENLDESQLQNVSDKAFHTWNGNKFSMTKTEESVTTGAKTWFKYTGDITLTADCSNVAFWLYQWSGSNNKVMGDSAHIFIDDVVLTPKAAPETQAPVTQAPATQAPATSDTTVVPPQGDMTAVVALIAVIGTAGVVFAAKKKH